MDTDETLVKEWLDECRIESTLMSYTFRMKTFALARKA